MQEGLFAADIKKNIKIDFIGTKEHIFVKNMSLPKLSGAKALKNEDFIDHEDYKKRLSYYKQVTRNNIYDAFVKRQEEQSARREYTVSEEDKLIQKEIKSYGYSPTLENKKRAKRQVSIDYMVSYEMPERLDKYTPRIDYRNYEHKPMFIEVRFFGPLLRPKIIKSDHDLFLGIDCHIPRGHEICIDMATKEVIGHSQLVYLPDSVFWSLLPGNNTLHLFAEGGMDEGGYARIQTRYDMT